MKLLIVFSVKRDDSQEILLFREKIQKEKENLNIECKQIKLDNEAFQAKNEFLENKKTDLDKTINRMDEKTNSLEKQVKQLLTDRNILGVKLFKTNQELALTNEKVDIYNITLQKGKIWYNRKLKQIKLLKLEIKHLRQEKCLMKKSVDNTANIRTEMFYLQRDLCKEKVKCRILEEELQNPLNVHRWRKLEATDPDKLELIKKVHQLQKRILQLNEKNIKQDETLRNLLKLQLKLQNVLAKQPDQEELAQLSEYKLLMREKNERIKNLNLDLKTSDHVIKQYQFDVDKLSEDLRNMKQKYFAMKKNCDRKVEQMKLRTEIKNNPEIKSISKFKKKVKEKFTV